MKNILNKIPHLNLIWLIRYWLGAMMIYHSYWAFFDDNGLTGFAEYLVKSCFPEAYSLPLAILSKSIEFFGGILLFFGFATRLVSFLIILVMGIAVFYMHKGLIWGEGELAFNYLLMAIILFFNPSIPFKINELIKPIKNEK